MIIGKKIKQEKTYFPQYFKNEGKNILSLQYL